MDSAHCRVFGVCDFIPGNAGIGVQLRRPRPPEQPWVRETEQASGTVSHLSHLSQCHICHSATAVTWAGAGLLCEG